MADDCLDGFVGEAMICSKVNRIEPPWWTGEWSRVLAIVVFLAGTTVVLMGLCQETKSAPVQTAIDLGIPILGALWMFPLRALYRRLPSKVTPRVARSPWWRVFAVALAAVCFGLVLVLPRFRELLGDFGRVVILWECMRSWVKDTRALGVRCSGS